MTTGVGFLASVVVDRRRTAPKNQHENCKLPGQQDREGKKKHEIRKMGQARVGNTSWPTMLRAWQTKKKKKKKPRSRVLGKTRDDDCKQKQRRRCPLDKIQKGRPMGKLELGLFKASTPLQQTPSVSTKKGGG